MRRYVPKDDMYKFDIQTLIPFEPIARLNLDTRNPTQKDINAVCGSVMYVAHKYERLEDEYKKVHSEKKALEGQLRALTKQTAARPQSGMVALEREIQKERQRHMDYVTNNTDHFFERIKVERNKFELIDRIAEAGKRNGDLQKALDKLQVEHDDKVSRLEKAEAKIKEMENAKDEKMKGDLMEVLGQVAEDMICPITLESLVCTEKIEVASDGHSYDKEALEKWLGKSQKSPMTGAEMERHTIPNRTLMSFMRQMREILQKPGEEENSGV